MRRRSLLALAALTGALALSAAPAGAQTLWSLEMHHNQTNFSHTLPGSAEVSTLAPGGPGANEVQRVAVDAETGQFTLSFKGAKTAPQAHDVGRVPLRTALRGLETIGSGNVEVARDESGTTVVFTVTFQEDLAEEDVPQLQAAGFAADPLILAAHDQYWFDTYNVGSSASSGQIELTIDLPPGVTFLEAISGQNFSTLTHLEWSCVGTSTVQCTTEDSLPRHTIGHLIVEVALDPGLTEGVPVSASATLSGGGAADSATDTEAAEVSFAQAGFGIVADSFRPDFLAADAVTPQRQAGGHPDLLVVPVDFNSVPAPQPEKPALKRASGAVRNLSADLPPGFLGDPTAASECNQVQFLTGACPPSSQVGRFDGSLFTPAGGLRFDFATGVFNMVHPPGVLTDLGFSLNGNPTHIRASLDPANNYAITTKLADVNESFPAFSGKVTIWGAPADPSHDSERCPVFNKVSGATAGDTSETCAAEHQVQPFVTMPFRCDADNAFAVRGYDSWQDSGVFGPELEHTIPGRLRGCDQVPFAPSVSVAPSTDAADSPSGLDVQIDLPPHEECAQIDPPPPAGEPQYECETATAPLKDATVVLPEGLAVNPAAANGLQACSEAQIALGEDEPVQCPGASKLAEGQVITPALPDPVAASVYLATPYDNPFGSLLAGYLVLSEPDRGLLVKIPGKIAADPASGQLTGSFEENPQLPFSRLELHFKGGAHSTLITPPTCGNYTAHADFAPWSGTADVKPSSRFSITHTPGGGCPSAAGLPNSPSFDAGAVQPLAGRYSPFTLDLSREDGSQRFKALNLTTPPGFTAKLAGAQQCSAAALAAAAAKSGREEQASPSCSAGARIGAVYAAAGAGPSPYWAPGTAYLAGPYKGGPLSMAIVTPALAGPFDLGTVVVRTALRIDPASARITAVSEPLPESLEGIPLDIRRARVFLDRPDFALNGTSCDPLSLAGSLTSTLGQSAPLMQRFQLAECGRLKFKPHMTLRLKGGTRRAANPKLIATVYSPGIGAAGVASVSVRLPRSAFLDQSHIRTICTRVQWAADACPKGSVYGKAWVKTPLLDYWLSGNVYLRSSSHKLPDLIVDLRGPDSQPLRLELAGRTDSVKGALRNRFEAVPDAPFEKARVVLFGGHRGLVVNSRNICAHRYRAAVSMVGHNAKTQRLHPLVRNSCPKQRKKRHHGHRRKGDPAKKHRQR